MSALSRRNAAYLHEMGVGPIWKQRGAANAPSAEAGKAAPEEQAAHRETPAVNLTDWSSLESAVAKCTECGLCRGRTNAVPGAGDRRAAWLFVGEGPGYNEDLQGEPFVGRSGQLLDGMMRAMGLRRGENTFIGNIVKCRPTDESGKDRPPTPEEADACMHYLESQVALIEPEIIVALGKTAAVTLLGMDAKTTLSSLRGKVHYFVRGNLRIPLIATYHPAYLLREPLSKRKAWADLCLALRTQQAEAE
jgi:DNA polymerase